MFARLVGLGSHLVQNKGRSTLLLAPYIFCAAKDSECKPPEEAINTCEAKYKWKKAKSVYEFSYVDIDGCLQSMEQYRDKVLIIVNVATESELACCNYQQLVALHEQYGESKGLAILAFPCNQFDNKEPGSEEEIKECIEKFNVKFDMASKVEVNGDGAHQLFKYLKLKKGGWWWFLTSSISGNFAKFLIDREGQVVHRFTPDQRPYEIYPVLCKNNWFQKPELPEETKKPVYEPKVKDLSHIKCGPRESGSRGSTRSNPTCPTTNVR